MYLVPVAGPTIEPVQLSPNAGPQTFGRHETCTLKAPPSSEGVSRFHARFRFENDRWRITDLGSRWGTLVNGIRLNPQVEMPLSLSDTVTILPWTFSFSSTSQRRGVLSDNDVGLSTVRTVMSDASQAISGDLLTLLLEASASIHSASSEIELARRLMESAVRGTGLPNAALLRPLDAVGRFEILASRQASVAEGAEASFSRTLISAAAGGQVAELSASVGDISQSMIAMSVSAALCVPLMLGPSAAAYLYLDARTHRAARVGSQPLRKNAAEFAAALGRLASLALANLKRIELAERQLWMDGELRAAAAAQKWILPPRSVEVAPYRCIGESRAGQSIGGDFFDAFELPDGRFAIAVGDVSGKGIPASVLMTATQGFLHASLLATGDPATAVISLNQFISPRRPEHRFVTLWVGVFDPVARELRYVDAGHGYALLINPDQSTNRLGAGEGLPLGIDTGFNYVAEPIPLPEHGTVLVVTDGIIEQFGAAPASPPGGNAAVQQFQLDGVIASLNGSGAGDVVARLFEDVIRHAGSDQLADDATAVAVVW
jgi:serine phosphatase RsbU (regulator of sigma subunit)